MVDYNKKVLVLGAGMVVKPIVHYLLGQNMHVTIATRTKQKAEAVLQGHQNGKAISWTIDQIDVLEKLVYEHDLTVSLLPYSHHVTVAEMCIKHKKNMLTTSYISPEMKDLDSKAKEAGIIILNEIGVDPGFDHMTAMEIIDRVHDEGGKIDEFYSLCGALCAPEASDNPFRYKFSWSPKGVVMASNNDATFLKNEKVHSIDTLDLFKNPLELDFPELEKMEVYPNRDSLPYIEIYGIPEVKTMFRGTFRYKNWCSALDLLKNLKLTGYEEQAINGRSLAQITADLNHLEVSNLKQEIQLKFDISSDHPGFQALEWLGVFDTKNLKQTKASPFDLISNLMIEKMMMNESERDMVIMQHIFGITKSDGQKEKVISRMIDYGNKEYTSIARTVALPAAIGVKLILDGTISEKGVHLPIKKSIYKPIINELKQVGIYMTETIEPYTGGVF